MPTHIRRTSLGACAACGAYGLALLQADCTRNQPEWPRPNLAGSRRARPDSRNILAVQQYERARLVEGSGDY